MKKKQEELLRYLMEQSKETTANMLSAQLKLSVRTIKSYISDINSLGKGKLILSSKTGYLINKDAARKLLKEDPTSSLPQTPEERSIYIIKQFAMEHMASLDLFDLCEQLFISYSTLKADIHRMNITYEKFHVQFLAENNHLIFYGNEEDKRKVISHVIFEETGNHLIDMSILKQSFSAKEVELLMKLLTDTFQTYNYYINDFSYMNLILHFLILIDRVRYGKSIEKKDVPPVENELEKKILEEVSSRLEDAFSIRLNESERFSIYMLFKTNANVMIEDNLKELQTLVGADILKVSYQIVQDVGNAYMIDLHADNFITPFSLHLKNLLFRVQHHSSIKNPMNENIKKECPLIYDIAIYISLLLDKYLSIQIQEDEISYIALHVGSEIERQKSNSEKINCILLCPSYRHLAQQLYNNLLIHFDGQINIVSTISYEYQLEQASFDLLLTTIPLQHADKYEAVSISPFVQSLDHAAIYEALYAIRKKKKQAVLRENFSFFFQKELFFIDPVANGKEKLIRSLCDVLEELEYVTPSYYTSVIQREQASSTAFGSIAIPHSVSTNACRTSISVVISKAGIAWDTHTVHIIFLIAISQMEKKTFQDLYEALIGLFDDESTLRILKEVRSFEEFAQLITSHTAS